MTTHIGLLRAINLAGINRVGMADLRALLESLGMHDPRTLLNSGNVVFKSPAGSTATLEALLEQAAAARLKVATEFFVRTAGEWNAMIAANPFRKEAKSDPGHLVVVCLKAAPTAAAVTALQKVIPGREQVRGTGRDLFITYPDGQGRSKLTATLVEKHLGTRGTARNWNTVLKIAAIAGAS